MADKEMYDYLSTVTPTYTTTTLSITPHGELKYIGKKSQVVHNFHGGGIGVISFNDSPYYDVFIEWQILTSSDHGTIMDFYMDANKANGMENSFYWAHPVDGHTYVAQFMSDFTGVYVGGWGTQQNLPGMVLRIIGRKADPA